MSAILKIKVKILLKKALNPNVYLIKLLAPTIAQQAVPGQFVHIRCNHDNYPLLRRPFSIHQINKKKGEICILFQVIGEGTRILSENKVGEELDILGPLGNGFSLYPGSQRIIIVGGGIGIAPLLALTEESIEKRKNVRVLIGNCSKEMIIGEESFKDLGIKVNIATEDGSCQYKGLVTDLLTEVISVWQPDQIFACGPKAMLKKVAGISTWNNINCQVSLEERMGCGIGACVACVCKIKIKEKQEDKGECHYNYKRVCMDGPIFQANEVIWDD